MEAIKCITWMKRDTIYTSSGREQYIIGIIQGLMYGICSIPSNTEMLDCELFKDRVLFIADCTKEQHETFMKTVERMFPGLCYSK